MHLDSAELKITKAKTAMMLRHPFFSMIGAGLVFIEAAGDMEKWCKTMATDGLHCFWNREFVDGLSVEECTFVICHEVLHCVFLHMTRRGTRNPEFWNYAGDYAINLICTDAKCGVMPRKVPGLLDEKYRGWHVDAIYDDLMKSAKKTKVKISLPGGQGDGDGEGEMWGLVIDARGEDGKPLSESEKSALEEELKIKAISAATAAKAIGKLPGGMEGLIEAAGKPKINWKDYIQNWVKGKVPDNYTWRTPNRKWMATHGIYMPRMEMKGAGTGVLSIDNSGSVSDDELRMYVTEIVGVIELLNPDKLLIIQHDYGIEKIDEWASGDEFTRLKVKGRGGTSILPVFKWVNGAMEWEGRTMDEEIDWMICFTDMEICDYPKGRDIPDWPVLWCATGPDNAGFGTYLDLRGVLRQ